MVINDEGLLKQVNNDNICVGFGKISDPYSEDSPVQPASLDLKVGEVFLPAVADKQTLDNTDPPKGLREYILKAGETAIVTTKEEIKMPSTMVGIGFPPNHVSVKGILMTNPGQIDPGYQGPLRFTVINMGRESYVLRSGDSIVSIMVLELTASAVKDYLVRHGGQKGRPPSWDNLRRISRDFLDVSGRATTIAEAVSNKAESRLKAFGIKATIIVALIGAIATIVPRFFEPWQQPIQQLTSDVAELKGERNVDQLTSRIAELERQLKVLTDQVNSTKR